MHGWLIYNEQDLIDNRDFADWFVNEAEMIGLQLTIVYREHLLIGLKNGERFITYYGADILLPEYAIVRAIDPLLSAHLEALNVDVFNSSEVARIANDKRWTHHIVQDLGLSVVDTIYTKRDLLPTIPPIDFPLIVKSAGGRGGTEVFWISNLESWQSLLTQAIPEDLIIQATNVQIGKDLRVYIVGKKIITSVLRTSTTDHRANYKLGGHAELYLLNEVETSIVMKIVNHFDFGMVGIDFLIGYNNELIFNEVEDIVGSRTLSALSNVNISAQYIQFIKLQLSLKREKLGQTN